MAAVAGAVVVCTYPAREHADEFVAVLRKEGVSVAVVPSDHLDGGWDVMVPGREVVRVREMVETLLAPD